MRVSRLGAATQPPAYAVLWQHAPSALTAPPRVPQRAQARGARLERRLVFTLWPAHAPPLLQVGAGAGPSPPPSAPLPAPRLPTPPFSFVPPAHSLPLPRSLLSLPSARRASACCRSEHVKTPVAEGQRHAAYERVECAPVFPSVSSLLSDLPLTSSQASLVSLPYQLPYKVTKPHAWTKLYMHMQKMHIHAHALAHAHECRVSVHSRVEGSPHQ